MKTVKRQKRKAKREKWCELCACKDMNLAAMREELDRAEKGSIFYHNRCITLAGEQMRERREWANFMRDIQLVQAAGCDTLCGSKWINAKGLNEAIKRYTDGDSQAVHTPGGGCCK